MYVAFNQVRDQPGETFEQFGDWTLHFCEIHDARRLVFDVRNNSAGDNTIFRGFINRLRNSSMNERGKLYLIMGRHTFLAAVNFTSVIEAQTNAILVGEDAGAGPNHYGDPKRYMLPHSKLSEFIATRYHQCGQAGDNRRSHEPAIRVQISHSQFFAKDDPVMDMILADG